MIEKWYYTHHERRIGPVSTDELLALAGAGLLDPFDVVWPETAEPAAGVEVRAALSLWGHIQQDRSNLPDWLSDLKQGREFGPKEPPQAEELIPSWLGGIRTLEEQTPAQHAAAFPPGPPLLSATASPDERTAPCPSSRQPSYSALLFAAALQLGLFVILGLAVGAFLTREHPSVNVWERAGAKEKESQDVSHHDRMPTPERSQEAVTADTPEKTHPPTTAKPKPDSTPEPSPEKNDYPKPVSPFDEIDRHALAAPRAVEESVETLAHYLTKPAKNETDKARAIFRWMTDRIAFDVQGLVTMNPGDVSPASVLKRRECVCEGYARLFTALCKEAGLDAILVAGLGKTHATKPEQQSDMTPHAWNAVKLDRQWRLLDVTWAAGGINGGKFVKRFNPFFFLTEPERFVFTHLPTNPDWQLLDIPVTPEEFNRWGYVPPGLFQLGVTVEAVRKTLAATTNSDPVEVYDFPAAHIVLKAAPLARQVKAGEKMKVRMVSDSADAMAFVQHGQIIQFTRQGNLFEGEIVLKPGELQVSLQLPGSNTFWSILRYDVKE